LTGRKKVVMVGSVTVEVGEDGADAERIELLTGYLRQELLQLDVDGVTPAPGAAAPPGSRGVDVAEVGALLVSLGGSAAGLKDVVTVVRAWLARGGRVRRTVRVSIGGDVLELSEVSRAEQTRLVDLFVERHSVLPRPGDPPPSDPPPGGTTPSDTPPSEMTLDEPSPGESEK
jgi:hypothetical protein